MRWAGNGLIILALAGMGWIVFPFVREELGYRWGEETMSHQPETEYMISIPGIKIKTPVIEGVNAFDRNEYQAALEQGVAQAKGSALPGETGTQYLFAHSSDSPFRITQYNTAFYRLNKLSPGDLITVSYRGGKYDYKVRELKTVKPSQVEFLTKAKGNQLILQTCTPIGTDWNRLLVMADPV